MTEARINHLEELIGGNLAEGLIGEEWIQKLSQEGFSVSEVKNGRIIFSNNQNKRIYLKYDSKKSAYSCGLINGSEVLISYASYPLVISSLVGIAKMYRN